MWACFPVCSEAYYTPVIEYGSLDPPGSDIEPTLPEAGSATYLGYDEASDEDLDCTYDQANVLLASAELPPSSPPSPLPSSPSSPPSSPPLRRASSEPQSVTPPHTLGPPLCTLRESHTPERPRSAQSVRASNGSRDSSGSNSSRGSKGSTGSRGRVAEHEVLALASRLSRWALLQVTEGPRRGEPPLHSSASIAGHRGY